MDQKSGETENFGNNLTSMWENEFQRILLILANFRIQQDRAELSTAYMSLSP